MYFPYRSTNPNSTDGSINLNCIFPQFSSFHVKQLLKKKKKGKKKKEGKKEKDNIWVSNYAPSTTISWQNPRIPIELCKVQHSALQ